MGRTYRNNSSRFDEEKKSSRKGKHSGHANNHKSGGIKVINDPFEEEDYFDEEVYIDDEIEISITRGQ